MPRLSRLEKEAVVRVIEEFLAGHDAEMVKACGLADTEKEGSRILRRLSSASEKLSAGSPETGMQND